MRVDVSDVYDAATKIGREFQRLIEQYGAETLSDLLAMVVSALEQLENMVDQLGEAYKENNRLCVELSQLEAEKVARHKLSKEKKVHCMRIVGMYVCVCLHGRIGTVVIDRGKIFPLSMLLFMLAVLNK